MRSEPLDALRGVAISMVIAKHYFGFAYGVLGVDLFFVLSGTLIGGILLDARGQPGCFTSFYGRRAFRILPLYWLLLAIAPPAHFGYYLFFAQVIPWLQFGYPVTDPTFATWTLAIEEQFYLVLPALIFWLPRRWLIPALWCGVLMAPAWRWLIHAYLPDHSWQFLLPGRLDALFGGVLIACSARGYCRSPLAWALLACMPPLCDVAYAATLGAFAFSSVVALVFGLTVWRATKAERVVILRPFIWPGRRCYALYLFHVIIEDAILGYIDPTYAPLIALPIACLVAEVSWRLIESPLIEYAKRKFPRAGTGSMTLHHVEHIAATG